MFLTSFNVENDVLRRNRLPDSIGSIIGDLLKSRELVPVAIGGGFLGDVPFLDITVNRSLLMFAKDKDTMIRGLKSNGGYIASHNANFSYTRGKYGGVSLELIKTSFKKGVATVAGNSLISRMEIRQEAERRKLRDRGYYLLLMTSYFLPQMDDLPNFNAIGPAGGIYFPWLAQHIENN